MPNIARFRNQNELLEEQLQQTDADYNHQLFQATVSNIRDGVDAGVLSAQQGQDLELNAIQEYRDRVAEDLGYDAEPSEEDEEQYSNGVRVAEFRAGNSFAQGLVQLLESVGYGEDLESGVIDLAGQLGLDPEDTVGLLTGDYVPHPELEDQIAAVFDIDEDVYDELKMLGEESRSDAGYSSEEEDSPELAEVNARYHRIDNELAEFKAQSYLKDQLNEIQREAAHGLDEGWFPPIAFREMLGSYELENDRLAAFSQLCNNSGTNAEMELYAMRKVLETFRRCGPLMSFSAIAINPEEEKMLEQDNSMSSQASLNFQLRKQRTGSNS